MIYQDIQHALENRYDLAVPCQVKHFVSHDKELVQQLTGQTLTEPEMLLVQEENGNLDVTLFLEQRLIDSAKHVNATHHASDQFDDYCTVLEGVSHFVYLVWNAQYGRQIKPIEMELQAEVDKFVFAALADGEMSTNKSRHQSLSQNLFTNITFTHPPGTGMHHRYRTANEFAKRYCNWLSRHYQFTKCNSMLNAELARFYRMNAATKFDHIKHTGH